MPLGLRGCWQWWASSCRFTQAPNTDRHGPFKGSYSKWGCSAWAVELAFTQACSHSYSAPSFQCKAPLLTSLIAFSEPGIHLWWVNKNTLHCQTSQHLISKVVYCVVSFLHCAAYSPFSLQACGTLWTTQGSNLLCPWNYSIYFKCLFLVSLSYRYV